MSLPIEERAQLSRGTSNVAIYQMVANALIDRHMGGGVLLDVGCGTGQLWSYIADHFHRYEGADAVRYDGFPAEAVFHRIDLDSGRVPLPDEYADVVVAVETIEHLENPRAFVRELTRLTKPGGWMVITTPNQLSVLSKLTLVLRNEFNAFRAGSYPAHLTALLEVDLRRIAKECGLTDMTVSYSLCGRIPGTAWHWPKWWSSLFPRAYSDNVAIVGRKSLRIGG